MFSKRLIDLLALPNSDHMSAQKLAAVVLEMQTVLKLASTLTFLQFFEQHTGELRARNAAQLLICDF